MSHRPGFSLSADVKDGTLKIDDARLARLVARLKDGKYELSLERWVATRSAKQNRAYWPCIVKPCSESSGYEPDEVHDILKRFCNPKTVEILNRETGEVQEVIIGGSTTTLDVEEFSNYFRRCQQFAAETWDCYCPDPSEEFMFDEKPKAKRTAA